MRKTHAIILTLVAAHFFLNPVSRLMADDKSYDVVVVGAGTGGVSAAIEAARLGERVALVEETDWIGGQMTAAAVSTMDQGYTLDDAQGIFQEFRERIGQKYAAMHKSIGTCYYLDKSNCYEPSVAQRVLYEMIDNVNHGPRGPLLDVYLRHEVVKILRDGKVISGVETKDGTVFHAKVVIDATEFGDLLPLSGALYRSSNNISDRPFHAACTQDITYVMVIKKYPKGVPPELVMHHAPPGFEGSSFQKQLRLSVQADGNPASMILPVSFAAQNVYRGVPDSSNPADYKASTPTEITRTSLDWFNDYPVSTDIFDRTKRHDIVCQAKLKTLGFLYYIQTELGEHDWSVANDEGYDTPYNRSENDCPNIPSEFKAIEHNMPQMPYVRESMRLVGLYTLTSIDNRREGVPAISRKNFTSAIALGDHGNDLHGCKADEHMEGELEHAGDVAGDRGLGVGPFQIPMESLIPREIDGLLAAEKNLSQSRLADGATRLQPSTMRVGQAAGVLAALAVKEDRPPREVRVSDVQRVLLEGNNALALTSFTDGKFESEEWRAAQFVAVHGWIFPDELRVFGYTDILSRGESAEILARAFELPRTWTETNCHECSVVAETENGFPPRFESWRDNTALKPRFEDVPLYSRYASAIEALAPFEVLAPCQGDSRMFCPGLPATVQEFTAAVQKLASNEERGSNAASQNVGPAELSERNNAGTPLSKRVAAEILYRYATEQKVLPVRRSMSHN